MIFYANIIEWVRKLFVCRWRLCEGEGNLFRSRYRPCLSLLHFLDFFIYLFFIVFLFFSNLTTFTLTSIFYFLSLIPHIPLSSFPFLDDDDSRCWGWLCGRTVQLRISESKTKCRTRSAQCFRQTSHNTAQVRAHSLTHSDWHSIVFSLTPMEFNFYIYH